jgi:ABC-type antimicrobial peptide transport system permease subunit
VNTRRQEISIRMALGARVGAVRWLVLKQGLALVLLGLAIGLPVALLLTRLLSHLLFGISPTDPLTFAGVCLGLLLVALVACYVPVAKASRVDPMTAMRTG